MLNKLEQLCNGKQSWSVSASIDDLGGDPCPGDLKIAITSWTCEVAGNSELIVDINHVNHLVDFEDNIIDTENYQYTERIV